MRPGSHSDVDLLQMRYLRGHWVVRAGNLYYGETLEQALYLARDLRDSGIESLSIVRMPHSEVVIDAAQIERLWRMIELPHEGWIH
jgi:hypothetical protein